MRLPLAALIMAMTLHGGFAFAQRTHPTPHQLLDEAMQPVSQALDELHATDAERHDAADTMSQAEAVAAGIVEARHRGATDRVQALSRRMQLLARIVRGRIEAARAEGRASDAERTALAAETRLVQARAALERAAELRLDAEHGGSDHAGSSPSPATASATPAAMP